MKFIASQLSDYLMDKSVRRNMKMLMKYVAFMFGVIAVFTILFQVIMVNIEGENHSWITGFYWTLTVMSTLGFGDITFESDIGRLYSIVVLLSGIVLLLIVLPFAFIRYFYAPLLETQTKLRAPREVPPDTKGHVIICKYDTIAPGLIRRLEQDGIPYFLIEPDPKLAADKHLDGISVISGPVDHETTYDAMLSHKARLILVNREDTMNTKILLSINQKNNNVPLVAIASQEESIDVLELNGATNVLPLKSWLGEQLANRVSAIHAKSHPIGQYKDLLIAELPVLKTPLAGKTVRETRLREVSGVSIIGIWERGRLSPARPDMQLTRSSVLVVIGTETQLSALDDLFVCNEVNTNPVLVIGGGRVGEAAIRALRKRKIEVNLVERDPNICKRLKRLCTQVFVGDASDYRLLKKAGVMEAPSVVLTTNDDAMNVFLASYCRKLNKTLRIVSRITEERNIDVILRAGTDFVLSYAWLGAEAVLSILQGEEMVVLGVGINLFTTTVPKSLAGKTLAETQIGALTGLTVIALRHDEEVITKLTASTVLTAGSQILMMGDTKQRQDFVDKFGNGS
ncbi:MAG: NAD-binding protein [Bacteroidota bacterium]